MLSTELVKYVPCKLRIMQLVTRISTEESNTCKELFFLNCVCVCVCLIHCLLFGEDFPTGVGVEWITGQALFSTYLLEVSTIVSRFSQNK